MYNQIEKRRALNLKCAKAEQQKRKTNKKPVRPQEARSQWKHRWCFCFFPCLSALRPESSSCWLHSLDSDVVSSSPSCLVMVSGSFGLAAAAAWTDPPRQQLTPLQQQQQQPAPTPRWCSRTSRTLTLLSPTSPATTALVPPTSPTAGTGWASSRWGSLHLTTLSPCVGGIQRDRSTFWQTGPLL